MSMFGRDQDVGPRSGTTGFARPVSVGRTLGDYDPAKDLMQPPVRRGALDAAAVPSVINGVRRPHTNHVEVASGKIEIDDSGEDEYESI